MACYAEPEGHTNVSEARTAKDSLVMEPVLNAVGGPPQERLARDQALVDAVWETLQITSPQGIEREALEEIAANLNIPLSILLGGNPDLVPNLASVLAGNEAATEPLLPSSDGHRANGTEATEESQTIAGDLSKIALLSTVPHTGAARAVSFGETFRTALHNLGANRTRGLLTMLGIIIGVMAVVVLQAVGNGLLGYVDDLTGQYGENNVTIQPARLIVNGIDTGMLQRTLSLADAEALAQPGAVLDAVAISPTVSRPGLVHAGNANFAVTAVGVWPDYLTAGGYTLTEGSFVSNEDVANDAWVIVLGANSAHTLFGDADPLGQTVWLNGVSLRVIGVLTAEFSEIKGLDDQVYLPLSTAMDRVLGAQPSVVDSSKAVDSIVLRPSASTELAAVQQESTDLLAERHQLDGGPPDFVASSLLQAIQERAEILAAMNAFMVVVAGISLLVGGIGIMNIMLVSVTERTREIGLRKAIGARSRDILSQFLTESMLISLVGAGIGVGIALLLVLLVSALWRPCPPSVLGTIIAVLAALATGLFFGVSPAKRAANLQPIEALRAE